VAVRFIGGGNKSSWRKPTSNFFTLIKAEEKLKLRFHGIKKNGGKV
jgi:hypothetical protein